MIANRLRGLANLHGAACVVLAGSLLLAYQVVYRYLPTTDINADVRFLPYLLSVTIGMIVSMRFIQSISARFHRLTWVDAARVTTRQGRAKTGSGLGVWGGLDGWVVRGDGVARLRKLESEGGFTMSATNRWLTTTLRLGNSFEFSRKIVAWMRNPEPSLCRKLLITPNPKT
jgi:hypothetical protein